MTEDDRYSRQVRYPPIGAEGQRKLAIARVLVVGCGALGSAVAEQLCRAGVGRLRLVDRDLVEASNLQRQTLYSEADAAQALPKVVAAKSRLNAINAACAIEAVVADVGPGEIGRLLDGCDLAIDGADNFALRHLLNDACCRAGVPWIYGACVGAYGVSLPIIPGDGPCLRCLQDQLPAAGDGPTCDTAGIIAPAVHLVAAWQVAEAMKLLIGDRAAVRRELWASDLWAGSFRRLALAGARDPDCASCGPTPSYPSLSAPVGASVTLCGRDAVQIAPASGGVDLAALAMRLGANVLIANGHLVRWRDGSLVGTCFRDGRLIVHGVSEPARARAFRDRWMG